MPRCVTEPIPTQGVSQVHKSYNPVASGLVCWGLPQSISGVTLTTLRQAIRTGYSLSTLNWITAFFMIAFHGLALAALWYFSWTNFLVALGLHWMAVGFGISLGYHRLHTHRGFKCSKPFEYFLAVCGTM